MSDVGPKAEDFLEGVGAGGPAEDDPDDGQDDAVEDAGVPESAEQTFVDGHDEQVDEG